MARSHHQYLSAPRRLLSWALMLALVLGGMAFVVDGALLVLGGSGEARRLAHAALASGALGVMLAAGLAPAVALSAYLIGRKSWTKVPSVWQGRVLLVGLTFMVCWAVLEPLDRRLPWVYLALVLGSTGLLTICLFLGSRPLSWRSAAGLLTLSAAAVIGDCWLSPTIYPELHMFAHLLAATGLAALLVPMQRRMAQARLLTLAMAGLILGIATVATLTFLNRQVPLWPTLLRMHGRHAPRLLMATKAIYRHSPAPSSLPDRVIPPPAPLSTQKKSGRRDRPATPLPKGVGLGLGPPLGEPAYSPGTVDLVLLITVECLRADILTQTAMPRLWAFAQRGAMFLRGYSAGSQTRQSLPALQGKKQKEDESVGDQLEKAGVVTSSVVGYESAEKGNWWGERFGFAANLSPGRRSAAITDVALRRIGKVGSRPHFVWLHYWEPHRWPRFHPWDGELPSKQWMALPKRRFLSSLVPLDAALDRLFRQLERRRRLSRTLIILTGDHGEALGDHKVIGHAQSGYEVMFRVPMVLIGPSIPAGRFDKLVSHHDIPHTVLGAFGVSETDGQQGGGLGRSWLRIRGYPEVIFHHFVVANSYRQVSGERGEVPMAVLAADQFKIHFGWEDAQLELYDLLADPGESRNLVVKQPRVADHQLKQLINYCKKSRCEGASEYMKEATP